MNDKNSHVFTLMVDNEFGVLTRITALIRRIGCNIHSLTVSETAGREIARLTLRLECRHHTPQAVIDRITRLDCVHEMTPFTPQTQTARELALLRVRPSSLPRFHTLCESTGAQILEENGGEYILSASGDHEQINRLLADFRTEGLVDLARTATIALNKQSLQKGDDTQSTSR